MAAKNARPPPPPPQCAAPQLEGLHQVYNALVFSASIIALAHFVSL